MSEKGSKVEEEGLKILQYRKMTSLVGVDERQWILLRSSVREDSCNLADRMGSRVQVKKLGGGDTIGQTSSLPAFAYARTRCKATRIGELVGDAMNDLAYMRHDHCLRCFPARHGNIIEVTGQARVNDDSWHRVAIDFLFPVPTPLVLFRWRLSLHQEILFRLSPLSPPKTIVPLTTYQPVR